MKIKIITISIFFIIAIYTITYISTGNDHNNTQISAPKAPLTVFVAAATYPAMQKIADNYKAITQIEVVLNAGSSATLARQITAGADWAVYISANRLWMNEVINKLSLKPDSQVCLLKDSLVLAVPADSPLTSDDINNTDFAINFNGYLALGDPASVPAGIYAKQALESMQWWQYLNDNVVPAIDVAAAARYIETNQCQAGIVYNSVVHNSQKVKIIHKFSENLHKPIEFMAIAKPDNQDAIDFLNYIQKGSNREIFRNFGFQTPGSAHRL